MKTIEIKIKNDVTEFTRNIQTSAKELDLNKVVGTVLSDFFRLVDLQAKKRINLFNLAKPFDLVVKSDGVVIDTTKIDNKLKTKFKLNTTAKSKRAFAGTVYDVVKFASEKTRVTTCDALVEQLSVEVETKQS